MAFPRHYLLAHEYTHSLERQVPPWGRSVDPHLNTPMRDSLMWVYEGQTQYWGYVLSSRSGLLNKQQTLDAIAMTAALYDNRKGREWRSVLDTTNDPIIANRKPLSWVSYQRSEDYYSGRPAGVARRRHADPREDRRQEVARRFRQRLLRRR
jgi:predicted metalloprotease with PDZ domain